METEKILNKWREDYYKESNQDPDTTEIWDSEILLWLAENEAAKNFYAKPGSVTVKGPITFTNSKLKPSPIMENKTSNTEVRCSSVHLDIKGITTDYYEKIWVDDPNEEEGGTFRFIQKKYKHPKLILNFVGEVNIDLIIGGVYTDGLNTFVAIDKNKIQNSHTHVDSFRIPKDLTCVSQAYTE